METKICCFCKEDLPATTEFFAERKLKTKTSLQSQCRLCQKDYRKSHYEDNKQKYIDKASKYKEKAKKWFIEFKQTLSCEICNESRWWVLDFHHKDPKQKEFNLGLSWGKAKHKILKEIEKCTVLCSNCHRDLHYQEKINANIV